MSEFAIKINTTIHHDSTLDCDVVLVPFKIALKVCRCLNKDFLKEVNINDMSDIGLVNFYLDKTIIDSVKEYFYNIFFDSEFILKYVRDGKEFEKTISIIDINENLDVNHLCHNLIESLDFPDNNEVVLFATSCLVNNDEATINHLVTDEDQTTIDPSALTLNPIKALTDALRNELLGIEAHYGYSVENSDYSVIQGCIDNLNKLETLLKVRELNQEPLLDLKDCTKPTIEPIQHTKNLIEIKLLDKRLKEEFGVPKYATPGSAAIDFRAIVDKIILVEPGDTILVPTKTKINMRDPNLALFLLPRSGLGHKLGMVLGNGTGLIDSDYQEEIFISVFNRSKETFAFEPYDRICQGVFMEVEKVAFNLIDDDVNFSNDTDRSGGFGHTGKS